MGRLIVIEGLDSSGKETQTKALYEYLKRKGERVKSISFPNYESDSSAPVKMYLGGEICKNADRINPFAASSFYAVDRYISYKTQWESFLYEGGIVVADRYTTSNMIHQGAKIEDINQKNAYLEWLYDYEFKKIALPEPDGVIFLDMPPSVSIKLMEKRSNKITGESEKDIHERDKNHLEKSYENAKYVAKKFGWHCVLCVREDTIRTREDIHLEIVTCCNKILCK